MKIKFRIYKIKVVNSQKRLYDNIKQKYLYKRNKEVEGIQNGKEKYRLGKPWIWLYTY